MAQPDQILHKENILKTSPQAKGTQAVASSKLMMALHNKIGNKLGTVWKQKGKLGIGWNKEKWLEVTWDP